MTVFKYVFFIQWRQLAFLEDFKKQSRTGDHKIRHVSLFLHVKQR
jgi:hypothetical protein